MAKIIETIEGYANMTDEEKLKALEELEQVEPDYTGYVKKDTFDKTASELAAMKKEKKKLESQLNNQETTDNQTIQELQEEINGLKRESDISRATTDYIALGYEPELAKETAEAFIDGDRDKVIINQNKFQKALKEKIEADLLKNTPKPGDPGKKFQPIGTLEEFKKLSLEERTKYAEEHPDKYRELYGGN